VCVRLRVSVCLAVTLLTVQVCVCMQYYGCACRLFDPVLVCLCLCVSVCSTTCKAVGLSSV
jgi:hypothetical protein